VTPPPPLGPAGIVGKVEGDLPFDPGLPLVVLDRKAWAPNDMRRTKGVVGLLRAGPSSSSIALSPMESERSVETLRWRGPKGKGEVWVGEEADRPMVEIDMRRRWSCAAAAEVLLDRAKMLLKVWVVKEPRRGRVEESDGLVSLLLAMLVV
jgi:hypothetical protein